MLSRRDRAVLEAMLPAEAGSAWPLGIADTRFDDFLKGFEAEALLPLRLVFRLALKVAAWVSPLLIGKLPPLTLHDRDTRERALEALASSDLYLLRQCVLVLKTVACFCYGADAAVRDAVGFPLQHDDPRRG